MRSFYEELALDFPETPESFRACVESAVEEQTIRGKNVRGAGRGGRSKAVFPISKVALPVAACLVLLCGTAAVASGLPVFQSWLKGLGVNEQVAEELLIHGDAERDSIQMIGNGGQNDAVTEEAKDGQTANGLFTVTDAYFDGATLMFWATPGETLDILEFEDHVYINGSDSRLEYVVETEPGSGVYECKVTVMDENLMNVNPDTLEVRLGVYVGDTGKQEASFRISSDKLQAVGRMEDQILELSYGRVEVCDLHAAPSSINFTLKWSVNNEEAYNLIHYSDYIVEDSSGNRGKGNEVRKSMYASDGVFDEAGGCWTFTQELELQRVDSSSEYILLIPCEGGYAGEDDATGTEGAREDMSFKIMLKGK